MLHRTYEIPPFEDASLTAICEDVTDAIKEKQPHRRAVIVCPGGAYSGLAAHEGDPVAFRFLSAGFATFVLRYSLKERAADFRPLCELALAIRFVREHAEEFHVDPDYIFTLGFSAGGHLAGSAGVLWDIPEVQQHMQGASPDICRPTGMILCYPVITSDLANGHKSSFNRLCGTEEIDPEKAARFSLEKHVKPTTSPAFLWHTFADKGVPVQNSLMMANALRDAGVPFELHIFPTGGHGLGLCNGAYRDPNPHNACWIDLAITWAKNLQI